MPKTSLLYLRISPSLSKKGKKSPSQGLTETIDALPQGWHTLAEDHLLSQGEWQLLSIARAIAADPAVLLLDEITASLDAETEERVLSALRRATKGHTVLSISHRVYEKRGRVVEIG